jgi:hypothetical protein
MTAAQPIFTPEWIPLSDLKDVKRTFDIARAEHFWGTIHLDFQGGRPVLARMDPNHEVMDRKFLA